MLVGRANPADLEKGAPELSRFTAPALALADVVFVQGLFEIETGPMCEMLPPALHPTLPPVVGFSIYDVPNSEWGAFRLAQLRIECRSGLRPRGLLVAAVIEQRAARTALAERFGFRATAGRVELERSYDETRVRIAREDRTLLAATLRGPQRIGEGDVQFVSSLHPATTPRGFRLVQVDTRFDVKRVERTSLELHAFDAEGWGEPRIVPTLMLPAVVGLADLTLEPIRFVCRADVMAFEGSEAVDVA